MTEDLMKAILAMDAYNRGYDAGIDFRKKDGSGQPIADSDTIYTDGSGTHYAQIGNATVYRTGGDSAAQAIGFYGIAYTYNGETVISYRGTDNTSPTASDSDITNGWALGLGNYDATQATMAIEFYKSVAEQIDGPSPDLQAVDISLTGHSLGGGLAGYVAALYGQDAYVIDSMDYRDGATNAHFYASLSPSDPQYSTIAVPLINLIYDGQTPWAVDEGGVTARHIDGEALDSPFVRHIPSIAYDLGDNVSLDAIERHSMATFVMRSYANGIGTNDWKAAAQYFWPVLYTGLFSFESS